MNVETMHDMAKHAARMISDAFPEVGDYASYTSKKGTIKVKLTYKPGRRNTPLTTVRLGTTYGYTIGFVVRGATFAENATVEEVTKALGRLYQAVHEYNTQPVDMPV